MGLAVFVCGRGRCDSFRRSRTAPLRAPEDSSKQLDAGDAPPFRPQTFALLDNGLQDHSSWRTVRRYRGSLNMHWTAVTGVIPHQQPDRESKQMGQRALNFNLGLMPATRPVP